MDKDEIVMEHKREQLWAKIKEVWLPEIYLIANNHIDQKNASENVVKMMANTIMGELYARGLMKEG